MRGTCGGLFVLLLATSLSADPPALLTPPDAPSGVSSQPPTTALIVPNETTVSPAEASGTGLQHVVDARFLLGFPTGVLLQVALDRQPTRAWVAEAFAGFELFNPAFGLGGRALFAPATGKRGDALVIGPGLDFLFFLGDHSSGEHWFTSGRDGYFVIPDVEVAWLHDFDAHFGWELGLDLGLGVAFWGNGNTDGSRVTVMPLLSVFTGFSF
jgi:hypothetical protein